MSSMGGSDVGDPHFGCLRVKNTFLDFVREESEASTIQRRGSAPPRLADDSAVYQFFGDEGSNFFSEERSFFSEGASGLAALSEGLGGLTDSGDEDGPASGAAAFGSGAASGSAGADAPGGQPTARDGGAGSPGNGAPRAGTGGGGPEPGGAGAAGAQAPEEAEKTSSGRTRKGRACKSKRDRCQKFLTKSARRLAENPDMDIQQIDLPGFVHGEWLARHARAGLERILRDDPAVPAEPDGPRVPGPQPAPPVPRVPGLQ